MNNRKISRVLKSQPTIEGAGVHLKRAFGNANVNLLDPFLLLDDFHSDNPDDYIAGFPWHPHRGIETVTYMLHGNVKHEDSLGNGGVIEPGDVQWMTAGSGIVHSEMPQQTNGLLRGLQLWVNLPSSHKMMDPRYREVKNEQIPEISLKNGIKIKIISGEVEGTRGPVRDIVVDIQYLDVTVPSGAECEYPISKGYTAFAYVLAGAGYFDEVKEKRIDEDHLVIFTDGDKIKITADDASMLVRFLLISGKPLREPVAWYGPIVMNTQEELQLAFEEYQKGTFIKHKVDGVHIDGGIK
ncbi:MAG: pirin family protein [Candidatus Aminicenantes bacterium]|nr:pirin family protein [Candidatus Aminicenantes bacterium]NIM81710.1 pirin family protein [Candidatus Aminicenantes bacterium]NIN21081.1 pirin family protein [Candidatus Aminicenantes bacterium]NIN44903.1 pirin family protein [Candidatus Aminicenantes bacterium]NIN87717.1 pirin family protein [Candidatus Aminicenantes bacterium]